MGLFSPIYGKITDVPNHQPAYKWGLPNIDVKYSQAPGQRHVSSDGFPLKSLHFFDIFKHLVICYIAIWKIWPIEISLIYRTEKDGDLTCKLLVRLPEGIIFHTRISIISATVQSFSLPSLRHIFVFENCHVRERSSLESEGLLIGAAGRAALCRPSVGRASYRRGWSFLGEGSFFVIYGF